ncbi:uncharacterized protein LOC129966927 [Argiope bruennichi]|uniref:Uncharacterized protein n=1 Tax=Argiope bruennichi TaxID=94029 RepID=A0A8T0EB76_ARGBR|nr:uncharacterized protein LOC129966927 [Argiope bruennichi]KAF8767701.1 hypothetical protein HNY73_020614 [Argiope bruennichi]
MRFVLISWLAVLIVESVMVSCQQDLPLWSGQAISKELLRPYLLDAVSSEESSDYESPKSLSLSSSRQVTGGLKKRVAMGVDLPDYILHYRGKSPDLGSFRERMQLSGRR